MFMLEYFQKVTFDPQLKSRLGDGELTPVCEETENLYKPVVFTYADETTAFKGVVKSKTWTQQEVRSPHRTVGANQVFECVQSLGYVREYR